MSTRGTLRLATRGSDLALRQAASVQEALAGRRQDVELVEVETTGDRVQDELIHRLGKTGAFVRSLDQKVIDGDVDAAVHSMKDMPTEFPEDLVVAGVPERAPSGDVLVTSEGVELDDLPDGAVVGTSSIRRKAQLLRARPDLDVEPLRGNVDTRVEKLLAPRLQREHERRVGTGEEEHSEKMREKYSINAEEIEAAQGGDEEFEQTPEEWFESLSELERRALEREVETEYDAIVLAEAGLRRSGLFHHVGTSRLPRDRFVPSPGQGAIAVTAVDDAVVDHIRNAIDHSPTRVTTTVERTILEELGGGCVAPIGVTALLQGSHVQTRVQVLSADGTEAVEETRDLPTERHARAAADFAADLRERGAAELIEAATGEARTEEAKRGDTEAMEE